MIKKCTILLLLFLFISACASTPNIDVSQAKWVKSTQGYYNGIITSGETALPGKTQFFPIKNGTLEGTLAYVEATGVVKGSIKKCTVSAYLKLNCHWYDKYGTGEVNFTFNHNATEFIGYWNGDGDEKKFLWSGTKQ
ncbi:MAG: hypothetical protein KAG10_02345 [Methylococcales bacterium]|nr:hypothetical protein [Methylococcales bacterium]MCK5924711.1 hypothetical protein [Methylococcales bacterium]